MTAEPLTADQERLLRFARSINGGLLDASPVETIDRLLATLDRERAEHAALREKARAVVEAEKTTRDEPMPDAVEAAIAALRAALDEVKG